MNWRGIAVLLALLTALPALAQSDNKIIYQQEGLWVLSSPWSTNPRWCEDHNLPGRSIPVNLFYDAPHEQRMDRLGKPFQLWVYDTILPAILKACGDGSEVDFITVAMYRKPSDMAPSGLLAALKSNKPRPWDSLTIKIAANSAEVVGHRPHDAQYHLNPQQISALDPRSKAQVNEQAQRNEINDYVLHQSKGLKSVSWFSQSGPQWCRHPYVSVIAEYDNDAVRQSLISSHPAGYLQEKIIPAIQQICPQFPSYPQVIKDAKQILVLKFRPKVGRIADERINPDKLNFKVFDDGSISLIRDNAYTRWLKSKKNASARGAVTQMVKLDNEWLLARDLRTIQTKAPLALEIKEISESLFKLKGFKARKVDIEKIKRLRQDALAHFETAHNAFRKAEHLAEKARKLNNTLSFSSFAEVDALIAEYSRHMASADRTYDLANSKLAKADSLIIEQ